MKAGGINPYSITLFCLIIWCSCAVIVMTLINLKEAIYEKQHGHAIPKGTYVAAVLLAPIVLIIIVLSRVGRMLLWAGQHVADALEDILKLISSKNFCI